MKFFAALFALMAVTSVVAAPAPKNLKVNGAKGTAAKSLAGKGSKSSASAASASNATGASNATSTVDNSAASDNSTAATGTSSAAAATRTRPCDQGDQSLAAGLQASVVIGIGQQAAVLTLQNATAAQDFSDGVTRLQQFVDTQGLQLQMAQGIADDGSLAQTQLKLLAASQTSQTAMVKTLQDAQTSAATLSTLLDSFLTSTNNAQDGASQALIDCFLPLTAVSG